ncbi:MAG: guanylate kinase [Planctomycetota bacterium]
MARAFRGGLVVISGPSGSGKTTICKRLLEDPRVHMSVSATTRPRRPNEVEGRDYYFFTHEQFDRAIDRGEFIEWAEVYGNRYGSLRKPLLEALQRRVEIYLMEIDVQGAIRLQEQGFAGTYIFIQPPSLEELQRRLEQRNANSADDVRRRLEVAQREISCRDRYEFVVVNRKLDETVDEVRGILGLGSGTPAGPKSGAVPR